mgnify:CR=1 FL=1
MKRFLAAVVLALVLCNCATTNKNKSAPLGHLEIECIESNEDQSCDPTQLEHWENLQFNEWLKKHG